MWQYALYPQNHCVFHILNTLLCPILTATSSLPANTSCVSTGTAGIFRDTCCVPTDTTCIGFLNRDLAAYLTTETISGVSQIMLRFRI